MAVNPELWIGSALQAVLSTIRALRVNADGAAIGKATLEQSRASELVSVDDSDQHRAARYILSTSGSALRLAY